MLELIQLGKCIRNLEVSNSLLEQILLSKLDTFKYSIRASIMYNRI